MIQLTVVRPIMLRRNNAAGQSKFAGQLSGTRHFTVSLCRMESHRRNVICMIGVEANCRVRRYHA
jgi:hypothetical protein